MITHYNGSRGPVLITSMLYPHLKNARDKLAREQPERVGEIEAMTARIAELEAEGSDGPEGGPPAAAAPVRTAPAPVGDNNPPAPTTFEAVKERIDDLMIEARNWCDGASIENQAQADQVARLMDEFRKAQKAADEARKTENEEFDRGKAAVQTKYAPLIADTKTQRGVTVIALDTLKRVLTPWLQKIEADNKAAAELAKKEADELAAAATAAFRESNLTDLTARETAEDLSQQASSAAATAKRLDSQPAYAHGGGRATSLRSYFTPVLTDPKEALLHYLARRPDDIKAWLQRMAEQDVQNGIRAIPGFSVNEDRRVA